MNRKWLNLSPPIIYHPATFQTLSVDVLSYLLCAGTTYQYDKSLSFASVQLSGQLARCDCDVMCRKNNTFLALM